ncbi:unnamed protein product [Linum trigynum]|uniref:Uncharacterized protein n=1 Tax=Linum trigynum TaxID=586398 RepID=A0AAV2CWX7_9ROSI
MKKPSASLTRQSSSSLFPKSHSLGNQHCRFPQPSAGGDNVDDQNPRIGDGDRRADLKLASLASRIEHGSAAPHFRFRREIEATPICLLRLINTVEKPTRNPFRQAPNILIVLFSYRPDVLI